MTKCILVLVWGLLENQCITGVRAAGAMSNHVAYICTLLQLYRVNNRPNSQPVAYLPKVQRVRGLRDEYVSTPILKFCHDSSICNRFFSVQITTPVPIRSKPGRNHVKRRLLKTETPSGLRPNTRHSIVCGKDVRELERFAR